MEAAAATAEMQREPPHRLLMVLSRHGGVYDVVVTASSRSQ